MAALNPRRARILMGGLIAAGVVFTVLVLALDEDGRPGFPAGVRLPAETAEGASWSPDGRWVAIPNRAGVLLRDPDNERSRQLRAPRTPRYRGAIPGRIGWSPDGAELRYVTTVGPESGRGSWATTVPVRGGEANQVALGRKANRADWGPRGWPLVFAAGPYATGPEGDVGPEPALWELAGPGARPRELVGLPGRESSPLYSPDGRRLLFAHRTRRGLFELWVAQADGKRPRRIAGPLVTASYSWSPNGGRIAIVGTALDGGRRNHLYVVPSRGGSLRLLVDAELAATEPAWTPGGRWIAYATHDGAIEKIRPGGGEPEQLAHFEGERVANLLWSPDGRRLAYSSEELVEGD